MNIQFFYRLGPPSELLWYGIPFGPWCTENLDCPGVFSRNTSYQSIPEIHKPTFPIDKKDEGHVPSVYVPHFSRPSWRYLSGSSDGLSRQILIPDFRLAYYHRQWVWETQVTRLIQRFLPMLHSVFSLDYTYPNFYDLRAGNVHPELNFSHFAAYISLAYRSTYAPGMLVCKFVLAGGNREFPSDGILPSLEKHTKNTLLLSESVPVSETDFLTAFILSADQAVSSSSSGDLR